MSRSLSSTAKVALFSQETAEIFLVLITISGPGMTTIRVVNNTQNIVSNGETFLAFPCQITLPNENEDAPPRIRLTIDNVDRQIVTGIRSLTAPPTVQIDVILASAPNVLEASFPGFTLRSTDYDALVVEGDLVLEDVLNESFPAGSFTPQFFPALFLFLICCGIRLFL